MEAPTVISYDRSLVMMLLMTYQTIELYQIDFVFGERWGILTNDILMDKHSLMDLLGKFNFFVDPMV